MQSKVKMIFLKILVTLALWQVVKLQEEGKMNVSTLSTGCGAVVLLFTKYHISECPYRWAVCMSREEFEHVRAETETLKHELNSWQNTTISILKTYLLDQGTLTRILLPGYMHACTHPHTYIHVHTTTRSH